MGARAKADSCARKRQSSSLYSFPFEPAGNALETVRAIGYSSNMTIHHQTVLDENGNPTAAIIPWDEFRIIKAEMERSQSVDSKVREVLDRRSRELEDGTVEGITTEEMFRRVEERLDRKRSSATDA